VACTGSNVAKGFLTYISHALILQKTWSNAVSGKSSEDMWHKQAELVLPWSILTDRLRTNYKDNGLKNG
jgi:hypothetical protein